MKRFSLCILSFFIFFSTIDLSVINLFGKFYLYSQKASISDVMKVQYDLLQQTKTIVANVCNNIAKDVESLLAPEFTKDTFIDIDKINTKLYTDNYFNYVKQLLIIKELKSYEVFANTSVFLFFFGFIFLFIIKYLGLLFTFGKKNIYQQYKKAYGI